MYGNLNDLSFFSTDNVIQSVLDYGTVYVGHDDAIHGLYSTPLETIPNNKYIDTPAEVIVIPLSYCKVRCGAIFVFFDKKWNVDNFTMSQLVLINYIVGTIISNKPLINAIKRSK